MKPPWPDSSAPSAVVRTPAIVTVAPSGIVRASAIAIATWLGVGVGVGVGGRSGWVGVAVGVGVGRRGRRGRRHRGRASASAVGRRRSASAVGVAVGVGGRRRRRGRARRERRRRRRRCRRRARRRDRTRHRRRPEALRRRRPLDEPVGKVVIGVGAVPGRSARATLEAGSGRRRRRRAALDERVRRVAPPDGIDRRPADGAQRDRPAGRRETTRVRGIGERAVEPGRIRDEDPPARIEDRGPRPRRLARHRRAGRGRIDDLEPLQVDRRSRPGWRARRTRPTRSAPPVWTSETTSVDGGQVGTTAIARPPPPPSSMTTIATTMSTVHPARRARSIGDLPAGRAGRGGSLLVAGSPALAVIPDSPGLHYDAHHHPDPHRRRDRGPRQEDPTRRGAPPQPCRRPRRRVRGRRGRAIAIDRRA